MKDSILEGAANSACLQSQDNKPSAKVVSNGDPHGDKGTATRIVRVTYSNVSERPKMNKDFQIGLNNNK